MTRDKQNIILEEMKGTVRKIREAVEVEAVDEVRSFNTYFLGLAYVMEVETGNEYHWSYEEDGKESAVVVLDSKTGKERRYKV